MQIAMNVQRNRILWMLFTLILTGAMVLTGCAPAAEQQATGASADTRVIKHEMGETELTGTPKRIVALEFSFVDALTVLNTTPVGIADENKAADVEQLTGKKFEYTSVGTRQQPNLETISALQPDLIIADLNRHKAIYEDLKKIAPTIVLKSRESSYQENLAAFQTIADTLGKKEEGDKLLAAHKAKIQELQASIPADEKRKVLAAVFRADSVSAHGSASFDGELLELVGIKNAMQNDTDAQVFLNLEQVVELNPDVIFLMQADDKLLKEWENNPLWQNINAVKNHEVHVVDRNLWTRFRGLLSAEKIVEDAIHAMYGKQQQ